MLLVLKVRKVNKVLLEHKAHKEIKVKRVN